MLQMPSMPSRPDIVLLEDSERGPGGRVPGIYRRSGNLVEVTTDFALADRVVVSARQHQRLCSLLRQAGWHDVVLHVFIVVHTGVMGHVNRSILEVLGITRPCQEATLRQVAMMGCRYSCDMLKAFWRKRTGVVKPSSDASSSAHSDALQRLPGVVTPDRWGGRTDERVFDASPGRGAARKHSRQASCSVSRKRCATTHVLHQHHSSGLGQPLAYQSASSVSVHASQTYQGQTLRRSARLAAQAVITHDLPDMPLIAQAIMGVKRPLCSPTYPPRKRTRLVLHQHPTAALHVSTASAASRSGPCCFYSC